MLTPGGSTAPRRGRFAGREFTLRVVSGIVLATLGVGTLVLGGWPFALVWLAAGIVGASEWLAMSRTEPRTRLLAFIGITIGALAYGQQAGLSISIALAILLAGALGCLVVAKDGTGRLRALAALLGAAIIALVPPALRAAPEIGILGPAWMFAVVWSTDIVAYFTGRTLGGPKLMPAVSPKKTWSGALGGLVGAILAGILLVGLARSRGWSPLAETSLVVVALVSAAASILSQAGDLVESALKRHHGVKDSGNSIPGHGGVMDRLDGFFAVAVLAGLYLILHRLPA